MKYLLLSASIILVMVVFVAGCFSHNNLALLPTYDGSLITKVVSPARARTDNRILLLDIDGIITEYGQSSFFYSKEPTTFEVRQKLERALSDPGIKAVILRVNSPGGGVNASDVVYQEIMDYRSQTAIPVVAIQMGVAASGGYYISCAADYIIAHPTTVTGSVGVIAMGLGFDGLFEKIGMESRVTKSGKLKDMGNPFDKWEEDEKAAMQSVVDIMYARFVNIVVKARGVKPRVIDDLQGRAVVAEKAKELRLIDGIGYIDDAIAKSLQLANIRDADVVMYVDSDKADRNVYTQSQGPSTPIMSGLSLRDLNAEVLLELARPRLMYMYTGH